MPRVPLTIVGQAYSSRSKFVDVQEMINLYPEKEDANSSTILALIGTAGLRKLGNGVAGNWRGLYTTGNGRLFGVANDTLYEISSNGKTTALGTLSSVRGYVSMVDSGISSQTTQLHQLFIVDSVAGYCYDLQTNTLSLITAPAFPTNPTAVAYKDGYFFVAIPNSNQFRFSSIYDCTQWDALDIMTKEGSSDNIVQLIKMSNELWVVGQKTIEVWYSTGNGDTPIARMLNATIDIGTAAAKSVNVNNNNIFWLGGNPAGYGSIFHATGYVPTRISTHAIEYQIGQMPRIDDAVAYSYQQEGHFFYSISFPTGDKTFVFDLSTGLWHEKAYWNQPNGQFEYHRALFHAAAFDENVVADKNNGLLYILDLDYYTDNGDIIRRVRTLPHIDKQNRNVFYNELELHMQKGAGL